MALDSQRKWPSVERSLRGPVGLAYASATQRRDQALGGHQRRTADDDAGVRLVGAMLLEQSSAHDPRDDGRCRRRRRQPARPGILTRHPRPLGSIVPAAHCGARFTMVTEGSHSVAQQGLTPSQKPILLIIP
jgi:hypothetical protein